MRWTVEEMREVLGRTGRPVEVDGKFYVTDKYVLCERGGRRVFLKRETFGEKVESKGS